MFPIRDHQSSGIFPAGTIGIIILTALVLVVEFIVPDLEKLFKIWALVPATVNLSDIRSLYPFLTSVFMHAGFMHFFSNMWFLWIFGDNVESSLGRIRYLFFYLTGGIIAGFTQYLFLQGESLPILGASGAIAAILGYYLIRFPHYTVDTLVPYFYRINTIELPAQAVLLFWFIIQLFNGTASLAVNTAATSGTAWWAHIGGFVYGMIIGKLSVILQRESV